MAVPSKRYPERSLRRLLSRREVGGLAVLEFALVTPVFLMILAGTVDFGDMIFARFRLDAAVAAASNYVIANYQDVSTSGPHGPAQLASDIAKLIISANTPARIDGLVSVNNGSTVTITDGVQAASGTPSPDSAFYCPTRTTTVTWGTTLTQNATCTVGVAGRFVSITASYTYTPIISGFSFAPGGTISAGTMVQVQ